MTTTTSACCWRVFSVAGVNSRFGRRWEAWLHPQEAEWAHKWVDGSRRQAWILGRIAAKQLLLEKVCSKAICPRQIQLISRSSASRGCPPLALIDGVVQDLSLSLAHSRDWIAVALAPAKCPIGIDVVDLDAVHPEHLTAIISSESRPASRSRLATAIRWAVIESAFKTLGHQQAFRPGQFSLRLDGPASVAWRYSGTGDNWRGHAQWWPRGGAVVALSRQSTHFEELAA